ncbi:MAG: hypothetical protein H6R26_2247 [Proteobacteria bacterium]|nr:hypothetical protein [Pseudomonadota bacterium]
MSKPIRVASICHNDDDCEDPRHRRVRLELTQEPTGGYVWRTEEGEDCGLGTHESVADGEIAALQAWGAPVWDLRATWRP